MKKGVGHKLLSKTPETDLRYKGSLKPKIEITPDKIEKWLAEKT
jgi:hypothetical protein